MPEPTDMQLLSKLLGKAGWQDVDLGRSNSSDHLSCAFISEYALLGIVFSHSTREVLGCWADSRVGALKLIASNDQNGGLKGGDETL